MKDIEHIIDTILNIQEHIKNEINRHLELEYSDTMNISSGIWQSMNKLSNNHRDVRENIIDGLYSLKKEIVSMTEPKRKRHLRSLKSKLEKIEDQNFRLETTITENKNALSDFVELRYIDNQLIHIEYKTQDRKIKNYHYIIDDIHNEIIEFYNKELAQFLQDKYEKASLKSNLSKSQISEIHEKSAELFESEHEQWKDLFSEPIQIKKPIKLKQPVYMLSEFFETLYRHNLIENTSYQKVLTDSKAFVKSDGKPLGKSTLRNAKNDLKKNPQHITIEKQELLDKVFKKIIPFF